MVSREASYQALADRLAQALPGWTVTRTLRTTDDPALVQPACIVLATEQQPVPHDFGTAWKFDADVILLFKVTDPAQEVDTFVNQVLDTIEAALACQPDESSDNRSTTLSGLVRYARMSGPVRVYQGLPGGQSEVNVPIEMLAA